MRNATAAIFSLGLILTAPALAQQPGPPPPVLREIVTGMPKGERQEVRVITATLNPGERTPFHSHRFPVTAYILEGAFTLEMEGKPPVIVAAGEAIVEPPGVKMQGFNRASVPTKVVILYVSDPDAPFLDVHPH